MIASGLARYWRRLRSFSPNARLYLLSIVVTGLSFSIYMLIFNLYVNSSGYPRSFLGELQSMPNLIALLCALPAGVLVDAIGRKPALILANVGQTAALLGIVVSPAAGWLRLSMIGFGLSQSLWMVSSAPFMMENSTEKERDVLFSANFGLQTLVGFVGTLLGGYLPTWWGGILGVGVESPRAYAATLGVTVVLSALALVPVLIIQEQPRSAGAKARSVWPWRNIQDKGLVARIFVPNIIISMGAAILIPYMNLFFKETFGIRDTVLGPVFAVSSVITGTATLAAPLLAGRWGRIRALVITQLVSIPFLLSIGFSGIFWVSAVAFWVRAALMNMSNPLYNAFAMEQVAERERATVSGLIGMSWNIGWTIGPFVSGYMQANPNIGFKPIFVITCTLYVAASILERVYFQKTDDRQRRAAFLREVGVSDLSASRLR
jgi:MFS family permease